jgi:hypothetical protein
MVNLEFRILQILGGVRPKNGGPVSQQLTIARKRILTA